MKVLFVHNYYQLNGGEDRVVAQEIQMLQSRGIEVELYSVHNDRLKEQGWLGKIKAATNASWSVSEYHRMKSYLMDMKPDLVHVHNFFPLISPSVYYACHSLHIPVVQTLHNYRLLCPGGTFMRENKVCESCLQGSLANSLKYGCYRNSKIQTLPVYSMIKLNRLLNTWATKVDRYIALTEFAKQKFIEGGIPGERIAVKSNFLGERIKESEIIDVNGPYVLYVGRLSIEKGVANLLEAWGMLQNKQNTKLIIVGDGPERDNLEVKYKNIEVSFLGSQDSESVLNYMRNARYVIIPSINYEGFPVTLVESFSVGTPVLCSRLGGLAEIVDHERTGFHFQYDDVKEISDAIEMALNYNDEPYLQMRATVEQEFETHYTDEVNYRQLMSIYNDVLKENSYAAQAEVSIRQSH